MMQTPAGRPDADIAGAKQRRGGIGDGEFGELRQRVLTGIAQREARARGVP
jgi:hypothetical protein